MGFKVVVAPTVWLLVNLLRYSDSNSTEIATQVEQPTELAELRRIVERFIAHSDSTMPLPSSTAPVQPSPLPASHPLHKSLARYLRAVDRNTRIELADN